MSQVLNDLMKVLRNIDGIIESAEPRRVETRAKLAAMDSADTRAKLTDGYRDERKREIQSEARKSLRPDITAALALVDTTLEHGESLTGIDARLRDAPFTTPLELRDDGTKARDFSMDNQWKIQVNETRALREELTRLRVREELKDAGTAELQALIASAASRGDLATLAIARNVVRKRHAEPGMDAVQRVLGSALHALPAPEAEQKITQVLERVADRRGVLLDLLAEVDNNFAKPVEYHNKARRVAELVEQHGSVEGQRLYAEETAAARKQAATSTTKQVVKEIKTAIAADESDASTAA